MSHNTCYQWKIKINVNLSGFKNSKKLLEISSTKSQVQSVNHILLVNLQFFSIVFLLEEVEEVEILAIRKGHNPFDYLWLNSRRFISNAKIPK